MKTPASSALQARTPPHGSTGRSAAPLSVDRVTSFITELLAPHYDTRLPAVSIRGAVLEMRAQRIVQAKFQ